MKPMIQTAISKTRLLLPYRLQWRRSERWLMLLLLASQGPSFNLIAQTAYLTQPDGQAIYSWGYGCSCSRRRFSCQTSIQRILPTMQVPGPTLIVTEGDTVTVNLTNNLPPAAGNTSILFPGFR